MDDQHCNSAMISLASVDYTQLVYVTHISLVQLLYRAASDASWEGPATRVHVSSVCMHHHLAAKITH